MSEELKENLNKILDSYAQEAVLEVTDGTAQDSYDRELNSDDSTLYEFKKRARDQLLELFEQYVKEIIGEDEYVPEDKRHRGGVSQEYYDKRNQLRAEQRSRLESQKKARKK